MVSRIETKVGIRAKAQRNAAENDIIETVKSAFIEPRLKRRLLDPAIDLPVTGDAGFNSLPVNIVEKSDHRRLALDLHGEPLAQMLDDQLPRILSVGDVGSGKTSPHTGYCQ